MVGEQALDPVSRSAAALLVVGEGGVLSRNTAATLLGCDAAETADVHVTVSYDNWVRPRPGLVVHHDRFVAADVERRHGLPMLSMAATMTELLCAQARPAALACLDQALAGLGAAGVAEFTAEVGRRLDARDDRRGTNRAESLLCLGSPHAESVQESKLRLRVLDAGFPMPTLQYEIRTLRGALLYRLDLAWPSLRIGLEYDGYAAHEQRAEYDAERDRQMTERGWIMIRSCKADLADPTRLFAQLRAAFAARGHNTAT